MIQLPSKIRTTLFNATAELVPYQLFSHEDDRLFVIIYTAYDSYPYFAVGRSRQDVENSDATAIGVTNGVTIFGPEPLWFGATSRDSVTDPGMVLVHGVYRV